MKNNSICYHIIQSSTKISTLLSKKLSPYQITPSQLFILLILWQKDNVSSKYLQAETELDSSTISGLIKRMAKQGYILKEKNYLDKRNNNIILTDKGKSFQQIGYTITKQVEDYLKKRLGKELINNTHKSLSMVDKNIELFI